LHGKLYLITLYVFFMIQRIQSVYLFLVFIFAILYVFIPKGTLEFADAIYHVGFGDIVANDGESIPGTSSFLRILVMILPFLIMILTVWTIFKYKQRLLQIKLNAFNLLLHILLIVVTFFYIDSLKEAFDGVFTYGGAIMFPLVSLIFIFMANRAIRKDEQLVRSADRLR
jgi:hypothetical protein